MVVGNPGWGGASSRSTVTSDTAKGQEHHGMHLAKMNVNWCMMVSFDPWCAARACTYICCAHVGEGVGNPKLADPVAEHNRKQLCVMCGQPAGLCPPVST